MTKRTMQSLGGEARAQSLSKESRSSIARRGAAERWGKLRATHSSFITLGGIRIGCANLSDNTRILVERSVANSIGRKGSGHYWQKKREAGEKGAFLPEYLAYKNLEPFISDNLRASLLAPMTFVTSTGQESKGIPATLLPEICNVWLKAREKGALTKSQEETARRAEVIMRALANVGIIALIDEATGYQSDRDRSELQKILEAYVSSEFLPWEKRFPNEYYEELFRLKKWEYSPPSVKRPRVIGQITNAIIYEKLPSGVLEDLRKKNPYTSKKGYRKFKHHQLLTDDIGNPHLEKHLAAVVTLMRVAKDWKQFEALMIKAFPADRKRQIELELGEITEAELIE